MPWASQAIGLTRRRWLIAARSARGVRAGARPDGQGQLPRPGAGLAGAVPGVVGELGRERLERA